MKKSLILFASLLTLSACHSSNDAISDHKEAFVNDVNQYIHQTHINVLDCSRYYVKPSIFRDIGLFRVMNEDQFSNECTKVMSGLFSEIQKDKLFENITLSDLKHKPTWEIYFSSKNKIQSLENGQKDFLNLKK